MSKRHLMQHEPELDDELDDEPAPLVLQDGEIPSFYRRRYADELPLMALTADERISIWQATRRTIDAVPNELMTISIVAAIFMLLVLVGILDGFGVLLLAIGAVLTIFAMAQGEEITHDTEDGVQRQYQVANQTIYEVESEVAARLIYEGELPPPLRHPPSISALVQAQSSEVALASSVLQAAFLSLWAWGALEIQHIRVHHRVLGVTMREASMLIVVPRANSLDVDGDVERALMTQLERWPNIHAAEVEAWPWKTGPTLRQLLKSFMGQGDLKPQVLQMVRQDAVGRGFARGKRKKFELIAEAPKLLNAESHNVKVLVHYIYQSYPSVVQNLAAETADLMGNAEVKKNS